MMMTNLMKKPVPHPLTYSFIVVNAILELGNDILRSLGVEEKIDDVAVFFG